MWNFKENGLRLSIIGVPINVDKYGVNPSGFSELRNSTG